MGCRDQFFPAGFYRNRLPGVQLAIAVWRCNPLVPYGRLVVNQDSEIVIDHVAVDYHDSDIQPSWPWGTCTHWPAQVCPK